MGMARAVAKLIETELRHPCGLPVECVIADHAIGGVADSFLAKNKAKTADAKLARATKWIGAVFIILTLVLNIL